MQRLVRNIARTRKCLVSETDEERESFTPEVQPNMPPGTEGYYATNRSNGHTTGETHLLQRRVSPFPYSHV